MNIRLAATAAVMLGMSACSYNSSPQLAMASDTAVVVSDTSTPVPRAAPIGGPGAGPQLYNSDNRSTLLRTGLNSNPNNPNGVAAGG